MALTERNEIDLIQISDNWNIHIRQATIVERDGEVIATSYHRWVLNPDSDISNQEEKVKAICSATWTEEVVSAYNKFKSENTLNLRE